MEDFAECRFLDEDSNPDLPVFFIYDRTSSLEENSDPKQALLYPALRVETTEDEKTTVTKQINLITSLILFSNKLEREFGKSLPVSYKLGKVNFFLLNVGKYTFSLKKPCNYPENAAKAELEMIYYLFTTFYGGFATSRIHTTEEKLVDNPDKEKATNIENLMLFLSKITRPQLAICVGSWSFKTSGAGFAESEKKLATQLSLLVESTFATPSVIGVLTMLNGKVAFTKNLKSKFVQAITLILSGELAEFGTKIKFEAVNNVTAMSCHLSASHISTFSKQDMEPGLFYALIHIHGDLSMTLLVKCQRDPLSGDWFQGSWRRSCVSLKDKLCFMLCNLESPKESTPTKSPSSKENLTTPSERLQLHKQSNIVYANSSRSIPPTTAEVRIERRKQGSSAALSQTNQVFLDWYTKAVSVAQQAFCDMPSVSEIRLVSASDYVFRSTQSTVNNEFFGSRP